MSLLEALLCRRKSRTKEDRAISHATGLVISVSGSWEYSPVTAHSLQPSMQSTHPYRLLGLVSRSQCSEPIHGPGGWTEQEGNVKIAVTSGASTPDKVRAYAYQC